MNIVMMKILSPIVIQMIPMTVAFVVVMDLAVLLLGLRLLLLAVKIRSPYLGILLSLQGLVL